MCHKLTDDTHGCAVSETVVVTLYSDLGALWLLVAQVGYGALMPAVASASLERSQPVRERADVMPL